MGVTAAPRSLWNTDGHEPQFGGSHQVILSLPPAPQSVNSQGSPCSCWETGRTSEEKEEEEEEERSTLWLVGEGSSQGDGERPPIEAVGLRVRTSTNL